MDRPLHRQLQKTSDFIFVNALQQHAVQLNRSKPRFRSRFNAFRRLREELDEARSQLEDRRTIDQAKRIVMRLKGLSEDEAYALMRRTAMNEKRKLVDIARSLITAAEMLK